MTFRDFDIAGFSIGKTVGSDTKRYRFQNRIEVIDLGLRLADVTEIDLQSEAVSLKDNPAKICNRLRRNGATEDEIEFLLGGERVELNAMPSDVFIAFVERKLTENGINKVIPDNDKLEKAFQLFARGERIRQAVEEAIEALDDEEIEAPDDLDHRVREYHAEHPDKPWHSAVRNIVDEAR